jgi:hypothetical protein
MPLNHEQTIAGGASGGQNSLTSVAERIADHRPGFFLPVRGGLPDGKRKTGSLGNP